MTGGLLGQCELARDERDMDRRLMDTDLFDGVLRFDEPRDTAELRFELLRSAWMRKELPVRWPSAVVGRSFRPPLALLCPRCTVTFWLMTPCSGIMACLEARKGS